MIKLAITLLFLAAAYCDDLPKGAEYLGKGIDVTVANLKPTTVDEVDATFGKPNIFSAKSSADMDQTKLTAGQFSISTTEVSTISEVTSSFSTTVSVSGSYGPFSGSASTTVRSFVSKFSSSYNSAYLADSVVSVAKLRLTSADLSTEFQNDVKVLPESYTNDTTQAYLAFIKKWGTHYIREATVGGRTSYSAFVTKTQQKIFKSKSVDVQAGMNAAFKVSVGVDVSTSQTDTNYQEVNKAGVNINAFALGGTVGLVTDYTSWSATVNDNPMPIIIDAVPYIWLVEDTNKREALKNALIDYFIGSLTADNTLELADTTNFINMWNDAGSGADRDLQAVRPIPAAGYLSFGDSTNYYSSWPTVKELTPSTDFFSVVTSYNSPILRYPVDYVKVYDDSGSGADDDGSFWAPVCEANYNPLGHVNVIGHSKPTSTNIMTCVHDRCVVQCASGTNLWSDAGSGADTDVTLWGTLQNTDGRSVNTFISIGNYDNPPPIDQFLCLKNKCVAQPLHVDATLMASLAAYYAVQPADLPPSQVNSASNVVASLALITVAVAALL